MRGSLKQELTPTGRERADENRVFSFLSPLAPFPPVRFLGLFVLEGEDGFKSSFMLMRVLALSDANDSQISLRDLNQPPSRLRFGGPRELTPETEIFMAGSVAKIV